MTMPCHGCNKNIPIGVKHRCPKLPPSSEELEAVRAEVEEIGKKIWRDFDRKHKTK